MTNKQEQKGPVKEEPTEKERTEFVTKDDAESTGTDQAATKEGVPDESVDAKSKDESDASSDTKMIDPPKNSIPEWQLRKTRAPGENVDAFKKRLAIIKKREAEKS